MNKLILRAFDYSYGYNQWNAMDNFDRYVGQDRKLYEQFVNLMVINGRYDELDEFKKRF